ncbi:MAG TPA: Ppx/GppA phosphatase family protein [Thermoanaerobaculia bacterium]|nr:Ppx/GppA phosphatase family protein [Thermoanaerobaculia bacterium]
MGTPAVVIQPLSSGVVHVASPDAGSAQLTLLAPPLGRLAAIDIGSNSIHMIVIDPEPNGAYRVLGREREMVRLGKSALGEGALSETAIRDGLEALIKMTTLAALKGADRAVAVATSAVREAANGDDFLARIKAQTGLDVQLLTGIDEGRLIYRAVREVVDLGPGRAAIVDIGGGSTEWIEADAGELARVVSLPLGSLRCAAAFRGDPPRASSVLALRRAIREQLAAALPRPAALNGREASTRAIQPPSRRSRGNELPHQSPQLRHESAAQRRLGGWAAASPPRLVATSGTAVCCADLVDLAAGRKATAGGLREVRSKELAQLVLRLQGLRRQQIADLPPVGGPRSESLLAGLILLQEIVHHAGVERFQVSDRALREGLVLAALGQPIPPAREPGELRRRQVLRLAERAPTVLRHNLQTARLALRLFDVTASLHGFGSREREWLEYAALLHDVGYSVHYRNHHKHTYYLIANASLDGFDQPEIEIIAHVARYHRGALPRRQHATLAALRPWQKRTIGKLAALLRLADALDRTHASRVDEVYGSIRKGRLKLEVLSRYQVELELEAAREHRAFFEQVFGSKLGLRQGLEEAGA